MAEGPRIAVLGAGLQGTTVALELARRGCRVDLFDRAQQPITCAGLQNEGKLHLGFVYGKDLSLQTTQRLAAGSLRFLPLLRRWIGSDSERVRFSSPFLYAVPQDSQLSPEAVSTHFTHVEACVRQLIARHETMHGDHAYPGLTGEPIFRPLGDEVRRRYFSHDEVPAAFATKEVAVDPRSIATLLRSAVAGHPGIQFFPQVRIEAVEPRGRHYAISTTPVARSSQGAYDQVINSLWDGRLLIDRGMGLIPDRAWIWRYKAGVRLTFEQSVPPIASVTFMLGSYGDTVQYGSRHVYLSWYPAGLLGLSRELTIPARWNEFAHHDRAALMAATFDGLEVLYPDLGRLRRVKANSAMSSGVIFAWGATDIDDPDSGLHQRDEIGVTSMDGYHSINTGKYCMAPALAMDVADRITPDPSPGPA